MRRWAAFALLLLMFCGACGLPIPSGTTAVRKISGPQPADETDPVKRIPAAPVAGESPQGIVQGFLAAGNEPDVAREYLTAGNSWNPSSTTVFTGDPVVKVTPAPNDTMTASATISPILLINDDGSTQVPQTKPLPFTLTRENGQWRIDTLPLGTELQQSDLASSFRRGVLGWLSSDGRSLVRESVLLPDPESLVPNLVAALIGGPSVSLTSAGVTSAVPVHWSADPPILTGTQLSVGVHTNGTDLVLGDLAQIRAQFAATLLSTEISSIQVTLNGQPLPAGTAAGSPITAADETSFDRDVTGFAATSYLATAGGIAPLVLPGPFTTGTPGSTPTPTRTVPAATSTRGTPIPTPTSTRLAPHLSLTGRAVPTPRVSPSVSPRATPSGSPATPPATVFAPGVPISAFAVSADGQRFAELRTVSGNLRQPVQVSLGSSVAEQLGPARDYASLAWGADDSLWLTTRSGAVYVALRDHAPQPVPDVMTPLHDLIVAPDGVHVVGISTTGELVAGLASDGTGGTTLGVTGLSQVAPSLQNVTAVAVVSPPLPNPGGLSLLVAGMLSANPLVPGPAGVPVTGAWRVSTGAPDPTDASPELLSETITPVTATPCGGQAITGLVARPTSVWLAQCGFAVEGFDQRAGPLDQQWVPVGTGLAGYPLG